MGGQFSGRLRSIPFPKGFRARWALTCQIANFGVKRKPLENSTKEKSRLVPSSLELSKIPE
ncbi:hypothetical protein DV515_00014688 [Chloebia gouldiae]|uniref:Uncharacterized protein n=1 Tax=Chloebia gouldiae TaxID=44316 RepID=A0A3L8RYL6_CHLGU|nr:hypothetical protein DV515_00014688 [Chloebia gouldiae]